MSNQKKFGVWMDTHHATVVGCDNSEAGTLAVLAHITGDDVSSSGSEKNENNQKQMLQAKFFKEIATQINNLEQRRVAISCIGLEEIAREVNPTLIGSETISKQTTWVTPEGDLIYNVIVMPKGDGDRGAQRNDVKTSFLLFH